MPLHAQDQPNSEQPAPARKHKRAALLLLALGMVLSIGCGGAVLVVLPGYPWIVQSFPVAAPVCGTWQTIAPPNIGLLVHYGWANTVAARSADDVWIGGGLEDRDDNKQSLTVHWNGQYLQSVPVPNSGCYYNHVNGIAALAPDDAWAVGVGCEEAYILHWNGQAWKRVPGPPNLHGLVELETIRAVAADDVWAAGSASGPLILHWDGRNWRRVNGPTVSATRLTFAEMAALGKDDLWIVGSADYQTLTLHWDGQTWTQVPSPNPCKGVNNLAAVSGTRANDVWAVGDCTNDLNDNYSSPRETLILHWDGRRWQSVPSPNPARRNYLSGVVALTSNDVWAVGTQSDQNVCCIAQMLVLHWDGQQWREVPAPHLSEDEWLWAAAIQSPDTIWAVGETNGDLLTARFLRAPCPSP